jgi:sugar phosphate isomerase/epimerase
MLRTEPFALNQNTCKNQELLEFIHFSRKFKAVELNFIKIRDSISQNVTLKDILEILETVNTRVISIFSLDNFSLCSDRIYKTKILKNFKLMMNYCYKLESNLIIVNPSTSTKLPEIENIPKWRIIKRTRKKLEDLSKRASNESINLGFDFSFDPESTIHSLVDAKEVLKPLEPYENLGYIIDTFHLAKMKQDYSTQLNDIKDLIFLFRLADFNPKISEPELRLLPYEGAFNFNKFFQYARKIDYHNYYSFYLSKDNCSQRLIKKFTKILKIRN